MSTTILFSTFAPFSTLSLNVPSETRFEDLYELLCARYHDLPASDDFLILPHSGRIPKPTTSLSELHGRSEVSSPFITLRLTPRLLGGKGGFGSQLRAAGGRMSSQKTSNNDSCRDLNGRKLSTIKEAKRLAEYVENEPLRKKAAAEAQKAKLEALEKKLGIASSSQGGPSPKPVESEPLAGKKHRFDDTEYLEESQEIVESVKSAVAQAMALKKKAKKTKVNHENVSSDGAKKAPEILVTGAVNDVVVTTLPGVQALGTAVAS